MSITLAATWNPRGELGRFLRLMPQMEAIYSNVVVSIPPVAKDPPLDELAHSPLASLGRLVVKVSPAWPQGRYFSLKMALDTPASHIQYADMDRLLRWLETRPAELLETIQNIKRCDALMIGRTPAAYATHPQALVTTEALSNQVVSHFVGLPMDVSAGSKGFSRRAVQCLVANAQSINALGADAEWPLLLHRARFRLEYVEVDGLDWESADRHRDTAADASTQQQAASAYDADPLNWVHRVAVAHEIIQTALETIQRPLPLTYE